MFVAALEKAGSWTLDALPTSLHIVLILFSTAVLATAVLLSGKSLNTAASSSLIGSEYMGRVNSSCHV